jgi:hypothetical protein
LHSQQQTNQPQTTNIDLQTTKQIESIMAVKKKGEKGSAYVFLKDPDYAWIPAKLIRSSGNTADVQIPEYKDEQSTICDGGKSAKKMI